MHLFRRVLAPAWACLSPTRPLRSSLGLAWPRRIAAGGGPLAADHTSRTRWRASRFPQPSRPPTSSGTRASAGAMGGCSTAVWSTIARSSWHTSWWRGSRGRHLHWLPGLMPCPRRTMVYIGGGVREARKKVECVPENINLNSLPLPLPDSTPLSCTMRRSCQNSAVHPSIGQHLLSGDGCRSCGRSCNQRSGA